MEFDGIRKTLPDGKRMFIVRRGNESFGFPTLSTLKYWLESNMNVQHSTMINLLHKNPK